MSNTTEITVSSTVWTEVAAAGTSGFMTNEGGQKIKYRESDVLPVDEIGHTLELEVGAYVSFAMIGSQKVYAKAVTASSKLSITLG